MILAWIYALDFTFHTSFLSPWFIQGIFYLFTFLFTFLVNNVFKPFIGISNWVRIPLSPSIEESHNKAVPFIFRLFKPKKTSQG